MNAAGRKTFPNRMIFPRISGWRGPKPSMKFFPQLSARADVETRLKNAVADTRGFLSFTSSRAREHAVRAARHGAVHYFHPESAA